MDKQIEDSIYGSGYVLLPRGIWQTEFAHCSGCTRELYLWLLLRANHTDARWRDKTIRRGQVVTSVPDIRKALSSRHGAGCTYYTKKKIETAKTNLQRMGLIRVDAIARGCIVTVVNYSEIQAPCSYRHKRKTNEGRSKGKMTSNEGNEENINDNKTTEMDLPSVTDLSTVRKIIEESKYHDGI